MITAGVFGCTAAVSFLVLSMRLRERIFDFDVWCDAAYSLNDDGFTSDDCTIVRNRLATGYLVSALFWLFASVQIFVFACCIFPKKYGSKTEGNAQEDATARKLGHAESGSAVMVQPTVAAAQGFSLDFSLYMVLFKLYLLLCAYFNTIRLKSWMRDCP